MLFLCTKNTHFYFATVETILSLAYSYILFYCRSSYALDQWCLWKLLGIKWYHHVRNDKVRRTTGQPCLSAIVQARRLSMFGHTAWMPDEMDAKRS